ncbi:MAG: Kazal-type serine protease inhibitor family protein [Myxococcota bacterium]
MGAFSFRSLSLPLLVFAGCGDLLGDTSPLPDPPDRRSDAGSTAPTPDLGSISDLGVIPEPDGGAGPRTCSATRPCLEGEFCDFASTSCGASGVTGLCRPQPVVCTEEYQPVCGCDGETHSNLCYAQRAGTDAIEGECAPTPSCADRSLDPIVMGAGWSWGFCAGTCAFELALLPTDAASPLECDGLALTIRGTQPSDPRTEHRGTLTAAGHLVVRQLADALVGVSLQTVYGCPDCADGGSAWIELVRGGVRSRHTYGYGVIPPELEVADRIIHDLIGGLRSCTRNLYVEPSSSCQPRR